MGWVKKIGMELEIEGTKHNIYDNGEFAYQVILGTYIKLPDQWGMPKNLRMFGDFRYLRIDGVSGKSILRDYDYETQNLLLGFEYRF